MAKSNYFTNTHALQTRPTIEGVRSTVAYSTRLRRGRFCAGPGIRLALRTQAKQTYPKVIFVSVMRGQVRVSPMPYPFYSVTTRTLLWGPGTPTLCFYYSMLGCSQNTSFTPCFPTYCVILTLRCAYVCSAHFFAEYAKRTSAGSNRERWLPVLSALLGWTKPV